MTHADTYKHAKRELRRHARHPKALVRRIRRLGEKPAGQFADLSSNNGPKTQADFDAYAKGGHNLVALKATEGAKYVNPLFIEQVRFAKRAGLIVLPYHFAQPDQSSAKAQAEHFVHTCRRAGLRMGPRRRFWFLRDELPGCLDYEVASKRSDDAWIAAFGHVYHGLTDHGSIKGMNGAEGPTVYGGSVIRENVTGTLSTFFWLAAYVTSPADYWPRLSDHYLRWAWQYSETIDLGFGKADASRLRCNVRELVRLAT
jgi:GH25 family lysozyme M1 (1,4-beta-N-acetylmuramidase)